MPFSSLFYHVIWATRDRAPLITSEMRSDVFRLVCQAAERGGVDVRAVGGTRDHVHVAASIPPSLAVAEAVRRMKGGSSHAINQITGGGFAWQAEYGVVTFAERHLPKVLDYIHDQERHHLDKSVWHLLERVAEPE